MKHKLAGSILSLAMVILLAGCGSSGLGDILGTDDPVLGGDEASIVRGTVDRVDTRNRTIVLTSADTTRSSLRNTTGTDVVYLDYDENTFVEYAGNRYEPAALEPGDRVEARAVRAGDRLIAEQIEVTYDVSPGTTTDQRVGELRGVVRDVDTRNRTIAVERDSWANRGEVVTVEYESNTPVYWQGRTYRPENLERGDLIDLEVREYGRTLLVEEITVIESVSSGSTTHFEPDVRGTVQWVDTRNRTITIERPTWMNNFTTGGTSSAVTMQYDSSTTVVYEGRTYSPANLERGDEVEVEVNDLGRTLLAEEIRVVDELATPRF